MSFKEIFNFNSLRQKIKLADSDNDFIVFQEEKKSETEKLSEEKFSVSEWNQEYELIYSAYILDR